MRSAACTHQLGSRLPADDSVATRMDTVVAQGTSLAEALADIPWGDGEVLAVGTSSSAISRFFLGSHASKIVRNPLVPVFLMPWSAPLP